MKNKILTIIKFLIFLSLGIGIFLYVYKDQNVDEIYRGLNKVNYFWILMSVGISFLSHLSRAIRWQMLIEPLGVKPKLGNTLIAILIGYLANMAFPRLGEVSRCGIIAKYDKLSFTQLIGTVIVERVIDVISTLVLLIVVLITQMGIIIRFLENNPVITDNIKKLVSSGSLLAILGIISLVIIILIYYFRHSYKHLIIYQKAKAFIINLLEGVKSIKQVKNKSLFVFHSVFIWFIYFLSMYFTFLAFGATKDISLLAVLTVFVMGTFGMIAPVQGGIGTWHFMVIGTLFLYSVGVNDAKIFALVAHGSMTFSLIIFGIAAFIILPLYNLKKTNNNSNKH